MASLSPGSGTRESASARSPSRAVGMRLTPVASSLLNSPIAAVVAARGSRLRDRRRAKIRRIGWAQSAWERIRAPLAVGLATLALIAQLLAPASHRMAAPGDVAGTAAELKAAFGEVAVLCIQADDASHSQAPADRSGQCDDCCPLCQLSAGAHALVLPTLLGVPTRIVSASETLAAAPDFVRLKPVRTAFAQPRAPPFEA